VVRLANQIIQRAVESRASDIHIEPFADQLKVRYRIDGILKETDSPPTHSTAAVISRIKIMSKLNIAERRPPQDGRIPLRVQGKEPDLRVSTVPTLFGESLVMRLLDKESVRFDFDALGFDGPPRERLGTILDMPYGIFLVTGPTGNGKSTTLYTALSRLNTQERKIITVEDPLEYQLAGINQIQVKPQIGMTFAGVLRSIVRQDPNEKDFFLYRAVGCGQCNDTGYLGRVITEVLSMTDRIRQSVLSHATATDVRRLRKGCRVCTKTVCARPWPDARRLKKSCVIRVAGEET